MSFAFEELEVWQQAVEFADHVIEITEHLNTDQKHYRLIDQLEAAVTSAPMKRASRDRFSAYPLP